MPVHGAEWSTFAVSESVSVPQSVTFGSLSESIRVAVIIPSIALSPASCYAHPNSPPFLLISITSNSHLPILCHVASPCISLVCHPARACTLYCLSLLRFVPISFFISLSVHILHHSMNTITYNTTLIILSCTRTNLFGYCILPIFHLLSILGFHRAHY